MKPKYLLLLLLAAVILSGQSCPEHFSKATGGGWFFDDSTGNKIIFGFTAQPVGEEIDGTKEAKGQFQLIDYANKTRLHGIFNTTFSSIWSGISIFSGPCSINGQDGYSFTVSVFDSGEPSFSAGDAIEIAIIGWPTYSGILEGGNIQVHTKKD